MGLLRIDSGKPSASQSFADWPKEQWEKLLWEKNKHVNIRFPHDCRLIVQFREEAEKFHKELGFKSADEMMVKGLELEADTFKTVHKWIKENRPDWAIGYGEVKALSEHGGDRRSVEFKEAQIEELGPHGNKNQVDNINLIPKSKGGTKRTYLIARLKRDNPELAEKVINQEMSANAAAIQAGFRKRTITIPEDPERAAETIKRRCSKEFVDSLKALL